MSKWGITINLLKVFHDIVLSYWRINYFIQVDVVFSSRSRDNISRTMDLRKPTIHKLLVINDRYEPWPEMQAALDKMVEAEKRALSRLASCSYA